jgi:CTP:molybdopterin cytidylyltransferase MocA
VLLGRALLDRIGELRGDVGFRELLAGSRVRAFECGELCDPVDLDTPDQLNALQ